MVTNEELKRHLENLGLFDLERLKQCFRYSYEVEPENRDRIQDILDHIDLVMKDKKYEKK